MGKSRRRATGFPHLGQYLFYFCLCFLVGCLKAASGSRAQGFGWDEDLRDPETKSSFVGSDAGTVADPNFCKATPKDRCFSLILRIPKKEMIDDLGLSVLALGASSREMRSRLDEACSASWAEYKVRYRNDALRKVRKSFVENIEKMRCIFLFVDEEVAEETVDLADNELGMSVRLTKFELSGESTQAKVRDFGLTFDSKAVHAGFRSASLFGIERPDAADKKWQIALGIGAAPVFVQAPMQRSLKWTFDRAAVLENLRKIATNSSASGAIVGSFVDMAKEQLDVAGGQAAAAASSAAGPLVLVGMGYNAFRSLCGENSEMCNLTSEKSSMTTSVNQEFADLVPSSETNELFRLSLVKAIQAVLDEAFTRIDANQLRQVYNFK